MGRRRDPTRVIGKCYACGGPVRTYEAARVFDPATNLKRLVHKGDACEGRAQVSMGATIEGSSGGEGH